MQKARIIGKGAKMIDPILILHLSDLHFGPNSRFHDIDPHELSKKFSKAVENEINKHEINRKIDLVIVTGDITERARAEEYKSAKDFFEKLAQYFELDHSRFIFVPGNHDVYWVACKRVELDQEELNFSEEELRKRMNSEKFKNFQMFLSDFCTTSQNRIDLDCDCFVCNIFDLKLSIAGLNSCEIESHRKEDHIGLLSKKQAQALMDRWNDDEFKSWLKIVAIHHNPDPSLSNSVHDEIEYLKNLEKHGGLKSEDALRFASDAIGLNGRENLKRIAEDCKVQLILHGHHHVAIQEAWPWRGQQGGITHILSAGSLCLNPTDMPKDQPNNFQIILLDSERNELHSWILVYDPRVRTEGIIQLGNFTSDQACPEGYHQKLSLPENFLPTDQLEGLENNSKVEIIEINRFPSPKIYYPKPYLLQRHFTGRVTYRQIITDWLEQDNNSLLVLTGLSGSGKSALTWVWFQHDLLGLPINDLLPDPPEALEKLRVTQDAFPQGVIWWSFYDSDARFSNFLEKSVNILSEWTENYALTSSEMEKLDKLIDILYQHRFLIILDGFERELLDYARFSMYTKDLKLEEDKKEFRACTDRYAAEFLKRVLSPNLKSRVLINSQLFPKELEGFDNFPAAFCNHEKLSDLTSEESVKFFNAQGVKGSPSRIEAICSTYGNHSLTLRILSGIIFFDIERPGEIAVAEEYDLIQDPESKTNYILSKVYEVMPPEISNFLSKISAFRSTITYKEILILNSFQSEEKLNAAVKELMERGLLQFNRDLGLYDLHPIVRKYAYNHLTDKIDVHSRLRDYYKDIAKQFNSVPDKQKSFEDLTYVIELYYHTAKMGSYDEAFRIFEKRLMRSLYYRFGAYFAVIELLTILVPYFNNEDLNIKKRKDQMTLFNMLAIAHSRIGQPRSAIQYSSLAVDLADKFGDKKARMINRNNLALEQIRLGKFQDAERILQHRVEGKDSPSANAFLHNKRALLFAYKGNFTNASMELNQSLKIINKMEARGRQFQNKIVHYGEKAILYLLRDLPDEALKSAKESLEFCLKSKSKGEAFERGFIESQWLIGFSLVKLANLRSDKADEFLSQANIHLNEALIRCRNINLVDLEPGILLSLARWYCAKDDFLEAANLAEQALKLADRCEYRLYMAEINNFLSQLYLTCNDPEKAEKYAKIAFKCALCDSPPNCYKPALDEAQSILAKLKK